jgi:hypothetical protein
MDRLNSRESAAPFEVLHLVTLPDSSQFQKSWITPQRVSPVAPESAPLPRTSFPAAGAPRDAASVTVPHEHASGSFVSLLAVEGTISANRA